MFFFPDIESIFYTRKNGNDNIAVNIYLPCIKTTWGLNIMFCILGASEQGSNKSGNIEMYAPSSFNETVTGETLSSISEKSETYSNGEATEDFIVSDQLKTYFVLGCSIDFFP